MELGVFGGAWAPSSFGGICTLKIWKHLFLLPKNSNLVPPFEITPAHPGSWKYYVQYFNNLLYLDLVCTMHILSQKFEVLLEYNILVLAGK